MTFSQHVAACLATLPHIAPKHRHRAAVREALREGAATPSVPRSNGPTAACGCGWAGRRCALIVQGGASLCPRCGKGDARGFWR